MGLVTMWQISAASVQISKAHHMLKPSKALDGQYPNLLTWSNCTFCSLEKKCWSNRQFPFLLEVVKANTANSRAPTRNKKAEPQLVFCCMTYPTSKRSKLILPHVYYGHKDVSNQVLHHSEDPIMRLYYSNIWGTICWNDQTKQMKDKRIIQTSLNIGIIEKNLQGYNWWSNYKDGHFYGNQRTTPTHTQRQCKNNITNPTALSMPQHSIQAHNTIKNNNCSTKFTPNVSMPTEHHPLSWWGHSFSYQFYPT